MPWLTEMQGDKEYRLRDSRMLWGCMRCQDGDHSSCHGCSCPCGESPYYGDFTWKGREEEWEEAKRSIERTSWQIK